MGNIYYSSPSGFSLIEMALREVILPKDSLVVAISREGEAVFPRADTRLAAGDLITVLTSAATDPAVHRLLSSVEPELPVTRATAVR
jgi:Trk K+ transport system NAD-binding subunit